MRIGILTFHFVSNQGAVLQCYALRQFLERQGHEVSVINYCPPYHTVRYAAHKNPILYAKDFWGKLYKRNLFARIGYTIRSFVRCLYLNIIQSDKKVLECYSSFRNKYIVFTKEYKSLKALQEDPPELDAYICGSDQLWNPELLEQAFDKAYFLDFGPPSVRRVSYAVSTGTHLSDKELEQLHLLCEKLDAVSLREYDEKTINAIGREVSICIDPTFFLTVEDYKNIERDGKTDVPYIFVYGFETNSEIINAIEEAKEKYHCMVINGSPGRVNYKGDALNISEYGPDEFLGYISHAECIVTNSFHATTFSIIYQKRFITVPHSTRSMRMVSLLDRLGLNACLYHHPCFDIDSNIDYENVNNRIEEWRTYSIQYLNKAIGIRA